MGSPQVYSKDSIWMSVTVDDYKNLSTARTLTLGGFNLASTIDQALQKISKKGNVSLENDIEMYGLYSAKKLLTPTDTFQSLGFKLGV